MADLEQQIAQAQEACTKQGDAVRSLKALLKEGKGDKAAIDAAILDLKNLKADLGEKQKAYENAGGKTSSSNREAFRAGLANTLERRFFYLPSFKLYGSVAGFYDYGPPGCAVKQNITQCWRQHFILEESMLEVECPAVTPEVVLKASGHVERFTDLMVTDVKTGDCHRADHLLEHAIEALLEDAKHQLTPEKRQEAVNDQSRIEELTADELGALLQKYGVKAPETKNDLSAPFPFNLMFRTSIGPRGDQIGYLRPETAQGIFVNFRDLLYYNGGKLPFAAAQIGQSYRNEISPRQGLLRVREFTQAEIEHFCNPDDKAHPKFVTVAEEAPLLYSRELQMADEKKPQTMSLGEAVSKRIIANETLAYFIGRTFQFLVKVGIDPKRLRFRQHLANEMAHYAEDCWDAEVECSYGWVECVGLADRSAFDLRAHAARSKQDLSAHESFPEPRQMEVVTVTPNKQLLGKTFKAKQKEVLQALEELGEDDALCLQEDLSCGKTGKLVVGSQTYDIPPEMVTIKKVSKRVSGRNFIPSVIEPSFGVGRIIYCMFEHTYYARDKDDKRTVFRFPPLVAPTKATVFPLVQKPELNELARQVSASLTRAGISNIIDTTGNTIGRRYARTDEIGVPFGITVDRQTQEDNTVTVRERDSTKQVRVPIAEVPQLLRQLVDETTSWSSLTYTPVESAADDSGNA